MRTARLLRHAGATALLGTLPALAHAAVPHDTTAARRDSAAAPADEKAAKAAALAKLVMPIHVQHYRPNDQRGINVFETPKGDTTPFTGVRLQFGAAFTQQFQGLAHRNSAEARVVGGANANQLVAIGHGFNNAVANAYLNVQLAQGVRVAMTSYLSSRHHNETWVKDGFLQIDASPIDLAPLNLLMSYVTVKAGHFEINYGDAHFRRTDNGNAMYNPLVGNYVMDAFTTQIGGEVYLRGRGRLDGAFLMGGMTNGEVRGIVQNAGRRSPAYLAKVGIDRRLSSDLRVRLTGSTFAQARSANQTLYSGDRAGSRYYSVVENSTDEKAAFTSGAINPGFNEMHAVVVNPFVKYHGLELFGNLERARGKQAAEATRREFTQTVVEGTYRFLGDRLFASARYNAVDGRPANTAAVTYARDVAIDRTQFGGGWFITPAVMMKGEWVDQRYAGFPTADIRNGARFNGFMVEAVVAF